VNESITFNTTLNLVLNKTNLVDLTTHTYRVYVNDSNGKSNQTEQRTLSVNLIGLTVSLTPGIGFTFRPNVERGFAFFGNESLIWLGNNTAMSLARSNLAGETILYNNGTVIRAVGNYTVDLIAGTITITNSSTLFNGTNKEYLTDKLNFSYFFFDGSSSLRLENISCDGQNETLGCLNVSTFSDKNINFSLLFNITDDPSDQRILEDFSKDALNWTVFQVRGNNTVNTTILNASVICAEIQVLN